MDPLQGMIRTESCGTNANQKIVGMVYDVRKQTGKCKLGNGYQWFIMWQWFISIQIRNAWFMIGFWRCFVVKDRMGNAKNNLVLLIGSMLPIRHGNLYQPIFLV